MAKNHGRGRRRRPFNLRKVRVAAGFGTGALAALDVSVAAITTAATDPYRLMSVDLTYKIVDLGAATDDGQEFGLAHSDYSDTEIEQCLESQGSIDLGDKIAQEQANRLVRSIGQMTGSPVAGGGLDFNDGRPKKTKLNWLMSTGDTLNLWIRNGSGAAWTTGSAIVTQGNMWIKDSQ